MSDFLEMFRKATLDGDGESISDALDADAVLISPISARLAFRGRRDLSTLLLAAYAALSDLHWTREIGGGNERVLLAEAAIGRWKLTEALVIELSADGRIRKLTPHVRPWLALSVLAVRLLPTLLRHPGLFTRAAAAAERGRS